MVNPGVIVSDVTTASVDIGTTTRTLAIEYDGPTALPARRFVKLSSLDWRAAHHGFAGAVAYQGTFLKGAAHALPLALPGFLAAQSKPGRGATLFSQWKLLNADAFKLRYTVDGENAPMPVRLYGE
jgi:hypothetical protein